jgi:hypothetical protein
MKHFVRPTLALALTTALSAPVVADFGKATEMRLHRWALFNFGVSNDIGTSAVTPEGYQRDKTEDAASLLKIATNLQVEFVTRNVAHHLDLMVLYPAENSTHIIGCIESGVEDLPSGKKNPSVQAIDLASGDVTTILRGMDRCDGVRRTGWGTILATEETSDGQAYEIFDPLNTRENTITDRSSPTSNIIGETAHNIAKRNALPTMAWEGFSVLDSGVVYGGDELRPGSYEDDHSNIDTDGGAMYKFVPETLNTLTNITSLDDSPLVAGKVYAMQVSCRDSKRQYGQGCEVGNAAWIEVDTTDARADANRKGATGYYRPEDLHKDPNYSGEGVRFCWTNTGNEGAKHYGEVMCAIDLKPNEVVADELNVTVNRFIVGNPDMNSPDSFEFQPGTGIHYVIEDHKNGDIWACLPDGADRDLMSDGCIKVISVVDNTAEPTGFFFDPTGTTAYLSIQHSADAEGTEFDGYPTDDLLKITGFVAPVHPATLDSMLDFGPGEAVMVGPNLIQLENFHFNGQPMNITLKINMDGTWDIQ